MNVTFEATSGDGNDDDNDLFICDERDDDSR